MPEMTVIAIIAGISILIFGGGVVTAARVMAGRKAKKSEE